METDERLDEIMLGIESYACGEGCSEVNEDTIITAKAALIQWRADHTERKCLEARMQMISNIIGTLEFEGIGLTTEQLQSLGEYRAQLAALNKKEDEL